MDLRLCFYLKRFINAAGSHPGLHLSDTCQTNWMILWKDGYMESPTLRLFLFRKVSKCCRKSSWTPLKWHLLDILNDSLKVQKLWYHAQTWLIDNVKVVRIDNFSPFKILLPFEQSSPVGLAVKPNGLYVPVNLGSDPANYRYSYIVTLS